MAIKSKKKIMVVDDDKEFLQEIKETLTSNGYDVVTVNDSTSTLKTFTKTRPDVIILDLKMPTKSGFEIASELRYYAKYRQVPIIAITGFYKDEDYVWLMDICGIKNWLEKPINPTDLIARIEDN